MAVGDHNPPTFSWWMITRWALGYPYDHDQDTVTALTTTPDAIWGLITVAWLCLLLHNIRKFRDAAHDGDEYAAQSLILPSFEPVLSFIAKALVVYVVLAAVLCILVVQDADVVTPGLHASVGTVRWFVFELVVQSFGLLFFERSLGWKAYSRSLTLAAAWASVYAGGSCGMFFYYAAHKDEAWDGAWSGSGSGSGSGSASAGGSASHTTEGLHLGQGSPFYMDDAGNPVTPGPGLQVPLWFEFGAALSVALFYLVTVFVLRMGRKAVRPYALFTILWRSLECVGLIMAVTAPVHSALVYDVVFLAVQIVGFPVTIYQAVAADTHYWRGMGRKLQARGSRTVAEALWYGLMGVTGLGLGLRGGKKGDPSLRRWAQRKPLVPDSHQGPLQRLLESNRSHVIDFAFLNLGDLIDRGAMAAVFRGTFRGRPVAVKVFTPPEIHVEDLESTAAEAGVLANLNHPTVVHYYGVCVCPPDLSLVFELCERGSLYQVTPQMLRDMHALNMFATRATEPCRGSHDAEDEDEDFDGRAEAKRGDLLTPDSRPRASSGGTADLGAARVDAGAGGSSGDAPVTAAHGSSSTPRRSAAGGSSGGGGTGDSTSALSPDARRGTSAGGSQSTPPSARGRGDSTARGDGSLSVVMEHAATEGPSIADLKKDPLLQPHWRRRMVMAIDAARAVAFLHSRTPAVIHRDIKSPNFLVTAGWRLKITDFGESRNVARDMTGLRGTVQWMSPEMLRDDDYAEPSDVYSLSMVLWELMACEPPFNAVDRFRVPLLVMRDKHRPIIPPWTPDSLADVIRVGWHDDPTKRPTAQQVVDRLERIFTITVGQTPPALPEEVAPIGTPSPSPHKDARRARSAVVKSSYGAAETSRSASAGPPAHAGRKADRNPSTMV